MVWMAGVRFPELPDFVSSGKVAGSEPFVMNKCSIYIILHSVQGTGVYSTCNINEFQKQKINFSGEYIAAGA
jgi:hypothetical protein